MGPAKHSMPADGRSGYFFLSDDPRCGCQRSGFIRQKMGPQIEIFPSRVLGPKACLEAQSRAVRLARSS